MTLFNLSTHMYLQYIEFKDYLHVFFFLNTIYANSLHFDGFFYYKSPNKAPENIPTHSKNCESMTGGTRSNGAIRPFVIAVIDNDLKGGKAGKYF